MPVLAGSAAYAVAEAEMWQHASLEDRPRLAPRFYAVVTLAMLIGPGSDFIRFNAVKMLSYAAVLNGILAPPLIVLVVLLTSIDKVMGTSVNSRPLRFLGWMTAAIMTIAVVGMFATT